MEDGSKLGSIEVRSWLVHVRHGVTGVSGERLVGEAVMESVYLDIDWIDIIISLENGAHRNLG